MNSKFALLGKATRTPFRRKYATRHDKLQSYSYIIAIMHQGDDIWGDLKETR